MTDQFLEPRKNFTRVCVGYSWVVRGSELTDGEECADAVNICKESPLICFLCSEWHGFSRTDEVMKVIPSLLLACFSQTHDYEPLIVLFFEDKRYYTTPNLEVPECVKRISEFPSRDNCSRDSMKI